MMRTPRCKFPRSHRRGAHGFALVEAMVSILIFSFGVLGLIGLEAKSIQYSVDGENRNRAALFASEIASSMWLAGNVTQTAAQLATWNTQANAAIGAATGLPNGGLPNATVTIVPVAGTTNATDITITWQVPSRTTTDQLTTRVILP
jgi:type IV pilus assembly protein PilV